MREERREKRRESKIRESLVCRCVRRPAAADRNGLK